MDKFNFWMPLTFEKSSSPENTTPENKYSNMIFEGLASDDSVDDEGESMTPNGFILDRFLKTGLINLDHLPSRAEKNKSAYWIGEPIDAYVKNNKFYVKGKLWEKSPEARAFWDKALQMKESGSSRKPGMSIEGKVLERDKDNPKKVKRALITNVALTFQPVNSNSYADIVKGKQSNDFVNYEFESDKGFDNDDKIILEWEDEKGNLLCLDSDFKIKVKKKPSFKVKDMDIISKNYEKGKISKKILDDLRGKVEKSCSPKE